MRASRFANVKTHHTSFTSSIRLNFFFSQSEHSHVEVTLAGSNVDFLVSGSHLAVTPDHSIRNIFSFTCYYLGL